MRKFLCAFVLVLQLISNASAQTSILEKRITISEENKTITELLARLEILGSFNFSYNTKIFDASEKLSIHAKNATVEEILTELFRIRPYDFKEHDGLIVIFRIKEPKPNDGDQQIRIEKNKREEKPYHTYVEVFDTSRVIITVTRQDTIQVFDTTQISITDTVRVYDTVRTKLSTKLAIGFQTSAFISQPRFYPQSAEANLQDSAYAPLPSLSAHIMLRYTENNFGLKTGAGVNVTRWLSELNKQFNYTDSTTIISQHFDTTWNHFLVDSFYTYKNGDTTWVKHYDSTMTVNQKVEYDRRTDSYTISETNRIASVSIPVIFYLRSSFSKKHCVALNAGLVGDFLFYEKSVYLVESDHSLSVEKIEQENIQRFQLSAYTALEYSYHVNKRTSIALEAFLKAGLTNIYSNDFMFGKQERNFGGSVAIYWKPFQ